MGDGSQVLAEMHSLFGKGGGSCRHGEIWVVHKVLMLNKPTHYYRRINGSQSQKHGSCCSKSRRGRWSWHNHDHVGTERFGSEERLAC